MEIFGWTLYYILFVFIGLLWIRFIVDWVQVFARQWEPRGPLLVALEGVGLGAGLAGDLLGLLDEHVGDVVLDGEPKPASTAAVSSARCSLCVASAGTPMMG